MFGTSIQALGRRDEDRPGLIEIVTPRTNLATVTPVENLLAALSILDQPRPFALEMAATRNARWFVARAPDAGTLSHLREQIGVAYPQAALRPLDAGEIPGLDPARLGPDEQVAACALALRAPQYLPLRTFADVQVDAGRSAQADPVLGVLGALGSVPDGWRALSQLVLLPAPGKWCDGYLRLAVERPLEAERAGARAASAGPSLLQVALLAGAVGCLALGLQAHAWYRAGDWLRLAGLALAAVGAPPALYGLGRWGGLWGPKRVHDPRLVEEKIARPAYAAQVRLAVFAPLTAPRGEVEAQLRRLAAAYRQYGHAAGNGFVPRRVRARGSGAPTAAALANLRWLPPRRAVPILNTRELAGLWHLPQASADVPLVERTTARERLPLPATVGRGCRVGVSRHQGREVPVRLPDSLLARHHLLVGKTRKGKSSLMTHIALRLIQPPPGEPARGVLLVDPHSDLARAVLGMVPPARREDVVFLSLGHEERPFGLNFLDATMGWGKRRTVENALLIFKREFDDYWGPRMEDVFRFALLTLYEANEAVCAADPTGGPGRQHTVLEIPALFVDWSFRKLVLRSVGDAVVRQWWRGYFEPMERRQQLEIVNPVQSKIQRYAGNELARNIVGQPRTTIDPRAWVRDGAIVLVDAAKSAAGEDTCGLVGAALINLVALSLADQGDLAPPERRRVTLLADEIHTMPGADYEAYLSELAKFGANAVLATQGLGRLDALDKKEEGRALRATIFSNVDGLFAFQVSAEDARYLIPELGGGLEEDDLVELGDYHCYARLSVEGEKLPAFSFHTDPPPSSDPAASGELAAHSARRHGRWRTEVEDDLRAAMTRIELASGRALPPDEPEPGEQASGRGRPRNSHRPPRKPKPTADQPPLLDPSGDAPDAPAA